LRLRFKSRAFRAVSAIALAALSIGVWRASKARCFQLVGTVTCRIETADKIVALSFDDGPTSQGIDAVLPVLVRYNVKATFFLIGKQIERNPGQARRLAAAGHELGNHSFSHTWMLGKSASTYDNEVMRTDALLKAEGAVHPTLFRPPFGKRLIGLPLAVERSGYRMVTWDVEDDGADAETPRAYADHILSQVRPGSIILLHPMSHANGTARLALPLLLDGLANRGIRVVPVGELLAVQQRESLAGRGSHS
jgi:peptidoglycan-N-acetylglucosamine deacetylase